MTIPKLIINGETIDIKDDFADSYVRMLTAFLSEGPHEGLCTLTEALDVLKILQI